MDATEYVLSRTPFVVRRTVRWGDCDPAGVVYTGRFTEYLLSAVQLFHQQLAGHDMESFRARLNVQTPCKAMSLVFHRALWPNEVFDMAVTVGELRTSSYDLNVRASLPDGTRVFEGVFTPICILTTERKSTAIPEELKRRLEAARETP